MVVSYRTVEPSDPPTQNTIVINEYLCIYYQYGYIISFHSIMSHRMMSFNI